jgi:hypothetical protein
MSEGTTNTPVEGQPVNEGVVADEEAPSEETEA